MHAHTCVAADTVPIGGQRSAPNAQANPRNHLGRGYSLEVCVCVCVCVCPDCAPTDESRPTC